MYPVVKARLAAHAIFAKQAVNPSNPLGNETKQSVVGRVFPQKIEARSASAFRGNASAALTRHVGLKPDLRPNELSGVKGGVVQC